MDKELFRQFLIKFWVKGLTEYKTLTPREKGICQREYLRRLDRPTKPQTKKRH